MTYLKDVFCGKKDCLVIRQNDEINTVAIRKRKKRKGTTAP